MPRTNGGQSLPKLTEEIKEKILTSELLNTSPGGPGKKCSVWTAHTKPGEKAYGRITLRWVDSRKIAHRLTLQAHRAIWAAHAGLWPDPDDDIHHTCGNPQCVKYSHLKRVPAKSHTGAVRIKGFKNQYTDRLKKG